MLQFSGLYWDGSLEYRVVSLCVLSIPTHAHTSLPLLASASSSGAVCIWSITSKPKQPKQSTKEHNKQSDQSSNNNNNNHNASDIHANGDKNTTQNGTNNGHTTHKITNAFKLVPLAQVFSENRIMCMCDVNVFKPIKPRTIKITSSGDDDDDLINLNSK